MKQKLRQIFKISLFATFFAAIGCNEDETPSAHAQEHEEHLVKEISFEELLKRPEFSEAYGKVAKRQQKNKSSFQARSAMEDQYGFTIASDDAKVIETDSITSYTLRIERDISDPSYFENLVIQVDNNGEDTRALILKYNLTSLIVPSEHGSVNFTADVEGTPIVFDASDSGKTAPIVCHYIIFTFCRQGGEVHLAGERCTNTFDGPPMLVGCTGGGETGGGDDGSMPGGSGPGSSGGGSGSGGSGGPNPYYPPNPPIITAPVIIKDKLQEDSEIFEERINGEGLDDCGKAVLDRLKNLTQNDIAKIISKLGGANTPYNLDIVSARPDNEDSIAGTNWKRNAQGGILPYNYIIKVIPAETMRSTDLAIAGTILHEIVHAYFLSLIDDCNQTGNCAPLSTFPELWNYYFSIKNPSPSPFTDGISQHNQLAYSYVKIIGAALQEMVTGYPVPNGPLGVVDQVYTDVAWYGLEGTIPYNNLPQADKDRMKFRFEKVELLNQSALNSSGQTITPIGSRTSPCN